MKCIMIRLNGWSVLNAGDDAFPLVTDIFTRTEIIDIVGQMLCVQLGVDEEPIDAFNELIQARIGYVVDRRNAHISDPDKHEPQWNQDERDRALEYFTRRYKECLPYIPDAGELKFMACVWHEDENYSDNAVCLVAEFTKLEDLPDECISQAQLADTVREAIARDRDDRRPLFAIFT